MTTNRTTDVEFELGKGTCYLWTCWSLASYGVCLPFGYCFASKLMSSQQVFLDDKRLNYKSDCWCVRTDRMVPLERIQDVNITQNCIARCCDVHNISIQTAGGTETAEVTIIAPKNPKEVLYYYRIISLSCHPVSYMLCSRFEIELWPLVMHLFMVLVHTRGMLDLEIVSALPQHRLY